MGSNNAYGRLDKGRELEVEENFYKSNKEFLTKVTTSNKKEEKKEDGGNK